MKQIYSYLFLNFFCLTLTSTDTPLLFTIQQNSPIIPCTDIGYYDSSITRERIKERLPAISLPNVVSDYVINELRSIEEPETTWQWLSNKLKYFFIFPYSSRTIQGLQHHEFLRACKQAQWIAISTRDTHDFLYSDMMDLQGNGKISGREADIVKDTMDRIQKSGVKLASLFSYAAHKVKTYGYIRGDKEIAKNIDNEGREIEQALNVLKRLALEKGVPRALSLELRFFLRLIEDIIAPRITTRNFKDIERAVHDITSCTTYQLLEIEYKKKIFGKQNRVFMLKEHMKYLKVRDGYYDELRAKLEHQVVEVPSFKRKISPILRDLDTKVSDLHIRIESSQVEIDFIEKELELYTQAFELSKKIFDKTKKLNDIPSISAGKGLIIMR